MNCFEVCILFIFFQLLKTFGQRVECDKTAKPGYHSTCRWDTTAVYRKKVVKQPHGRHTCSCMAASALIETEMSIQDNSKTKLSYQSMLDCLCLQTEQPSMFSTLNYIASAQTSQGGFCMSNVAGTLKCTYGREYDGYTHKCLTYSGATLTEMKPNYYSDSTLDEVKNRLKVGAFIAVIQSTDRFRAHQNLPGHLDDRSNVFIPRPWHKAQGAHALLVVGWRNNSREHHLLVKNSWGSEWGVDGYSWILYQASDKLGLLKETYNTTLTRIRNM